MNIPYTIKSEPTTGETEWHYIHDFFHGFGYCKNEQYVWFRDLYLIELTNIKVEDLDEIYIKLQPFLEERLERMRKYQEEHPFKIPTTFRIPNIKRQYPSILEALCSNSLKEDVQDD